MKFIEMRLAIAKLVGWKQLPINHDKRVYFLKEDKEYSIFNGKISDHLPNWPEDLNEMHKLEMALPDDNSLHGRIAYRNILFSICRTQAACMTASADQRAFAYLRLFGQDCGVAVGLEQGTPTKIIYQYVAKD